jgi:hypothetical protein
VIYGGVDAEGIVFDGVDEALRVPQTELRLFGKPESFTKRRMGVALAYADDVETARARAKEARQGQAAQGPAVASQTIGQPGNAVRGCSPRRRAVRRRKQSCRRPLTPPTITLPGPRGLYARHRLARARIYRPRRQRRMGTLRRMIAQAARSAPDGA